MTPIPNAAKIIMTAPAPRTAPLPPVLAKVPALLLLLLAKAAGVLVAGVVVVGVPDCVGTFPSVGVVTGDVGVLGVSVGVLGVSVGVLGVSVGVLGVSVGVAGVVVITGVTGSVGCSVGTTGGTFPLYGK